MPTKIEWTDETWEVVKGCTPASEGCANCYARRLAEGRLRRFYPKGFGNVEVQPGKLSQPFKMRRPRRIFVCSRSDLFHERVPDAYIGLVFEVMDASFQHTFQVLTKRPDRMVQWQKLWLKHWPDNVWAGVSVENQARAEERLPLLAQVPAKVRWVSLEPLLGPVDLKPWLRWRHHPELCAPERCAACDPTMQRGIVERVLDWVVLGGESGPNARPMHPDWVRTIRDRCREAGVPFWFKQWGEWVPSDVVAGTPKPKLSATLVNVWPDGTWSYRIGKRAAGNLLDGKKYEESPRR